MEWVVGRGVGWVVGEGGKLKVGYTFRTVYTSYESKKYQPKVQTCLEDLSDVSLPLGSISDPWPSV